MKIKVMIEVVFNGSSESILESDKIYNLVKRLYFPLKESEGKLKQK